MMIESTPFTVELREGMTYCGRDGRLSRRTLDNYVNGGATSSESFVLPNVIYDALGNVTSLSYPQCTHAACASPSPRTVTSSYAASLLSAVGAPGNPGAYASAITYHPNLMVNQVVHGNGLSDVYALDPNAMRRPAAVTVHARHESPVTGRFLSVDQGLNARAALRSSQRWNRYAYAVGNPLKLVDPDGKEAIVFVAGPSGATDPKGAFGHAALYVTSKTGKAGISYGGIGDFEKGVRGFIAFYTGEGRQVRMYVLKTTPEQDQKMVEFLKQHPTANINPNATGADLMVTQNCTTAVCNTLQAGGVLKGGETATGAMTFLSKPSELQASLDTGELSDDVKTVVIFDPEADKKAQQTSTDLQRASCFFTGVCGVALPPQ